MIKNTIVDHLSNPQTHELMVDDYIVKYLTTVFFTADYTNKDILSTIIKIVSPIIFNLRLTSSKDEAAEVVSAIFSIVSEHHPTQNQQQQLKSSVSALAQI